MRDLDLLDRLGRPVHTLDGTAVLEGFDVDDLAARIAELSDASTRQQDLRGAWGTKWGNEGLMTDNALVGKRAIVVGGGSGIGLGSARLLARDGATVTIVGRTEQKSSWDDFQVYEELEKEGKLTTRISEWLPFDESIEELNRKRDSHPASDNMLHTGMLKGFMDGSLGSKTAAMLEPFSDDPGNSGIPQYDPPKLNAMTRERVLAGYQIGFHAIGDKGVQMALDAFGEAEKAAKDTKVKAADGSTDYRLRVEHAQVTTPQQIARFKELKVIASMQPSHLLTDMNWAESRLGPKRAETSYAWAEFLRRGVVLAFGTDYPVEPVTPFRGLYSAVTRMSEDGKKTYVGQKLTIEQAIAAYTTGAAFAEFAEKQKGKLEPGMLADFVVLDRDLTAATPPKILETKVLRTVVGGKTVFEAK